MYNYRGNCYYFYYYYYYYDDYYYYFWCKALATAPLQYPRGARHAMGTWWGKREACGSR